MRTNLKTRLFAGIAIAIIFVLILSSLSYYTSIRERQGEYMVNHTMEVKSKLRDISIHLKDYTTSIRTLRRYDNAANIYKDVTPEMVFNNMERLEILMSDNEEQNKEARDLRIKLDNIFRLWNSINFVETRSNPQKEKEYYNEETLQLQKINEVIRQMDNVESKLLAERQKETDKLLDFNNFANIGGTLLILAIVSVLCYIINREFTQRIEAEKKLRDNLQKLEVLNSKTNNYNDILNGVQVLIAECQKAIDTDHFLKILLDNVVAFLNIPSAVAYLTEEGNNDYLVPSQSHGVAPALLTRITRAQLPANEQDSNQHVAIVSGVPADFWKVTTGLGSSKPGQLAYLFLYSNKKNIAVIELGNFKEYTTKQIEYLQMITNAISVRLAAVQIEQNRNSLLQQLQTKQEILINQQEELRLANDELTQQTQALQASEEELRVQEEELKQINVELEEKNEALESAREVLALKAAELEVSGKYKSEFLANMSHELRTPLNSVLILAGLLRDNKDNNLTSRQIEYSNIIHKSGSDLLKLINDILDLSKIEAGKVDLVIEDFTIKALMANMHQLFFVVAEENGINFIMNLADSVPETIRSDKQKLEQVIKNLLSNAFKFTPGKGTVTLNIRTEPLDKSKIIFEVADTGIGIPEGKQNIIFEAFKQADGSTNRKYGGTGLGLSISRELAKILGGSISLTSKEQQGSTFAIHIPATLNVPVTTTHPRSLEDIRKNLTKEITTHGGSWDGHDKTILIIEDDTNFSSILQNFAEERHYKTLLAFNGKEGLEMAAAQKPDAIILDMQMPVMDGWAVLKKLKDSPTLKNIPVHIISASDDIQLPLQDAIAYLRKPVSKEDLEQVFSLIGMKLQNKLQKLLILKGNILQGDLLNKFTETIPLDIDYDFVENFEEAVIAGKETPFDCIIVDIGDNIDKGIEDIEWLKETQPFKESSVIILIDKEISPVDERKLKRVSEAVIMNSREAQRRLSDELDLFLHKIKEADTGKTLPTVIPFEADVLNNKKVLVADDDMRNVFALVSLLEEHQMEVITAGNGREAVDILASGTKPDIVLMDVMMPEMDGYEAMQYIRTKLMLRNMPLIAITAKAMTEDKDLCLAAGASDYISKPVDTQKLLSLMRVWLSQ